MNTRKIAIAAGLGLTVALAAGGIAWAATAGRDEAPLTGAAREQAIAAALAHTGGGTVVETEAGDDGAAYAVEIRLRHGSTVEVQLDEGFEVISEEVDGEESGVDDGLADD